MQDTLDRLAFNPELAAFLGARYGAEAEAYLKGNIVWVSMLAALFVVGWTMLYRRLSVHAVPKPPNDQAGA